MGKLKSKRMKRMWMATTISALISVYWYNTAKYKCLVLAHFLTKHPITIKLGQWVESWMEHIQTHEHVHYKAILSNVHYKCPMHSFLFFILINLIFLGDLEPCMGTGQVLPQFYGCFVLQASSSYVTVNYELHAVILTTGSPDQEEWCRSSAPLSQSFLYTSPVSIYRLSQTDSSPRTPKESRKEGLWVHV